MERQNLYLVRICVCVCVCERERERELMSHISLVCTIMSPIKKFYRYNLPAPFSASDTSFKRDEFKVDEEEFVEEVLDEHVSFIR